jgi:ribA/ribD-fused uncharacterized protein
MTHSTMAKKFTPIELYELNYVALNAYSFISPTKYCKIVYDGILFDSAVRLVSFLKAKKYNDPKCAIDILKAEHPSAAEKACRQCDGVTHETFVEEYLEEALYIANKLKFSSNKDLYNSLMKTGDRPIYYCNAASWDFELSIALDINSPDISDPSKHPGSNLLGTICEKIREEFKMNPLTF